MPKTDLSSLIKQVGAAAAPSMVPEEPKPPAPPPKEETKELSDILKDRRQRLMVARLIQEQGELGRQESEIKKKRKQITAVLKKFAGDYKVDACISGDWRLSYFSTDRSSLDKQKLLDQGVSPEVIRKATVKKTSYSLRVALAGAEEEEEEETEE